MLTCKPGETMEGRVLSEPRKQGHLQGVRIMAGTWRDLDLQGRPAIAGYTV